MHVYINVHETLNQNRENGSLVRVLTLGRSKYGRIVRRLIIVEKLSYISLRITNCMVVFIEPSTEIMKFVAPGSGLNVIRGGQYADKV